MADIFLSYAREDVDRASSLAVALTAEGWSVFWDRHIPPGRTFEDYLEQRVRECRVQIVLWSPHSVASQWVKIEAAFGRDRNVLIPVLIAEAAIPFGYGHLHAADLTAWAPESKSIAFQELVSAIESLSPRTSPRKKRPTHHETAGRVTTEEPNPVSTRDQVRGLHSDNSPGFSVSAMPNLARLAVAIVLIAGTASIGVFWALRQSRQSGIGNTPQHTGPSANTTAQETVAGTLSPNQLKLFDELVVENQKLCDGGDAEGCNRAGILYVGHDTGRQDLPRSAALFKKACDGGVADGCDNLGMRYQNGEGIPASGILARDRYKQACNGGSGSGCTHLANLYRDGGVVRKDIAFAATLYQKACDSGYAVGCDFLGDLYAYNGTGVPKDLARARVLYKQACDGGFQLACKDLQKIK